MNLHVKVAVFGTRRTVPVVVAKPAPDAVWDAFIGRVEASGRLWQRATEGAARLRAGGEISLDEHRELVEVAACDALLRLGRDWEGARSNWAVAAVTKDSSALRELVLKEQAKVATTKKFRALGGTVELVLPLHPNATQVRTALDPDGMNVKLGGTLREHGGVLADPYAARLTALTTADERVSAAVIALRNMIMHTSQNSADALHTALGVLSHKELQRRRRLSAESLGSYLRRECSATGRPRVLRYHDLLIDIAERLGGRAAGAR